MWLVDVRGINSMRVVVNRMVVRSAFILGKEIDRVVSLDLVEQANGW